jgi:hypothetical protein
VVTIATQKDLASLFGRKDGEKEESMQTKNKKWLKNSVTCFRDIVAEDKNQSYYVRTLLD